MSNANKTTMTDGSLVKVDAAPVSMKERIKASVLDTYSTAVAAAVAGLDKRVASIAKRDVLQAALSAANISTVSKERQATLSAIWDVTLE